MSYLFQFIIKLDSLFIFYVHKILSVLIKQIKQFNTTKEVFSLAYKNY
jgi:hypothetical protein